MQAVGHARLQPETSRLLAPTQCTGRRQFTPSSGPALVPPIPPPHTSRCRETTNRGGALVGHPATIDRTQRLSSCQAPHTLTTDLGRRPQAIGPRARTAHVAGALVTTTDGTELRCQARPSGQVLGVLHCLKMRWLPRVVHAHCAPPPGATRGFPPPSPNRHRRARGQPPLRRCHPPTSGPTCCGHNSGPLRQLPCQTARHGFRRLGPALVARADAAVRSACAPRRVGR